MDQETYGYVCPRCGASLEITPETMVIVCDYCGYPSSITGVVDPKEVYVVESVPRKLVEDAFWRVVERDFDLRRLKKDIVIREVEGTYVPVWVSRVKLSGEVSYYFYQYEGKKRRKVYRVSKVDSWRLVSLVARRQARRLGVSEAVASLSEELLKEKARKLIELSPDEWQKVKLQILNTEYDAKTAEERLKEDALDMLREEFKAEGEIDGFQVSVEHLEKPKLFLIPVWNVYYSYKESVYSAFFSGWGPHLLLKTEPVTGIRRGLYLASAWLSILASSLLAYIVFLGEKIDVRLLILPLLGVGGAYTFSKLSMRDVRLER
ncbi:MAG: hypothetical protein J7L38_06035 [Thermoproteales archaeon]|nr:hypothetical protein [Thermoproteales archaeon]